MYREFVSKSAEDTEYFAEDLGKTLANGDIILFEGDLGAGKTTFTKGLARALGVEETVTSPTFALINEYYGEKALFHFDLYRINSFDDLYAIGFFDYLDRGVIAAEWSENIAGLFTELNDGSRRVLKIRIEKTGECERKITYDSWD